MDAPIRLGVCSWSLRPESAEDLVSKVRETGLSHVQLALDPLRRGEWDVEATAGTLNDAGIEIVSGMMGMQGEDYETLATIRHTGGVRLEKYWDENLRAAEENAQLARQLGLSLVTFHAGFIPENRNDPERAVIIERLRAVTDRFSAQDVRVGFETGQETADTLLAALSDLDRPNVGVNFDPANMILYGMGDPVEALGRLASKIVQIHIKDAIPTDTPGTWGSEVAVGAGAVNWPECFDVIDHECIQCDLIIEREAGETRLDDIRRARQFVESTKRSGGIV